MELLNGYEVMEDDMNILYIVPAMYPYGWAYASRALNITRLMCGAGHKVTVMCDYLSDGIEKKDNLKYEEAIVVISTGKYASQRNLKDKLLVKHTMKKTLEEYLKNHKMDYILCPMTGGKYSMVNRVANRYNLPIVLEICEWYSFKNWSFGRMDPRFWKFQFDWKYIYPKAKRVLCISRLLEEKFTKKGVKVTRIPTILDTNSIPCKKSDDLHSPIKLVFIGGITGGKDELSTLIETICSNNLPFEINVYGPSETAVYNTLQESIINCRIFKERIHIHGFVDQQLIEKKILDSDYGILIRPKRRSSHAGFPTKLGEYFSAGLPVIANDTGDICLYLKNMENGILLEDNDQASILKALELIMHIGKEKYCEMSKWARRTSENDFDYRKYIDNIEYLLR